MKSIFFIFSFSLLALFFSGCAFERHYRIIPEKNQVIQVTSGDRWFLKLNEDASTGYTWTAECDDDDVEVTVKHYPRNTEDAETIDKAFVTIRIHRGYDGPSAVVFKLKQLNGKPKKSFTVNLFKRTGDCAFWEQL